MEESRLVKMLVARLREDGGKGWWKEYEVLRRKSELDNERGWWPTGRTRLRQEMRRREKKKYI